MRWSEISNDPNSSEAVALRRNALREARAGSVFDRNAYLANLVKGKRVLDVGVVNHRASEADRNDWLHAALVRTAGSCIGIDVLASEIEDLKKRGYDVICHNILEEPLNQKFEVMVCGELLEHLDSPGRLLAAAKAHLEEGGRLVLTTPNPYYLAKIRDALFDRVTESVDHVTLFCPSGAAELGERQGLELVSYRGVRTEGAKTLVASMVVGLFRLITSLLRCDDILCRTWIFEFQPVRDSAAARSTSVS
jgi:SAM-dependent methyltransferase